MPEDVRPYGRRAFLALLAGGVSSYWWAQPASRILAPLTSQFSQLAGDLLPVGGWRIYTISGTMPLFDQRAYRLGITGLVRKPASLSYDDLRALPQAHQVTDFHCVTGWSVDGVRWSGVRFAELLSLVDPMPNAKAIKFVSAEEPYVDYLTLDQALLPNVMVALEMDGAPLSRPHGSPARVVIPEMYGYKGVKWLAGMELVADEENGYWENLGYDQNAWVGRSNGYSS